MFTQIVDVGSLSTILEPERLLGSFEEFWLNFNCIYRVVDKAMDESNVDDLWHDVKIKMNAIIDIEWKNCLRMDDPVEQER